MIEVLVVHRNNDYDFYCKKQMNVNALVSELKLWTRICVLNVIHTNAEVFKLWVATQTWVALALSWVAGLSVTQKIKINKN